MYTLAMIWLCILALSLRPLLKRGAVERARKKLIDRIEVQRGSRVLQLIHREEKTSILGFPISHDADREDSEDILRSLNVIDADRRIDLVLHVPVGRSISALQIARAVKNHRGRVTVFVPHSAMSGGALIAFAADEVVMGPDAVLGLFDPAIGSPSAPGEIEGVVHPSPQRSNDESRSLARKADRATCDLRATAIDLLPGGLPFAQVEKIVEQLTTADWAHAFAIDPAAAREMGLSVDQDMPIEIARLTALYVPSASPRAAIPMRRPEPRASVRVA